MYGKIFESMYDGSLATVGPWQALVTFQQMIVLADRWGVVDMTAESLSRRTTIPLDIITPGIAALEQPDSHSRDPGLDGRRIVRLRENTAWGWRIVNHAKYRALRTAEERRAYQREWQSRKRAQDKRTAPGNGDSDTSAVIERIPCTDGEFEVRASLIAELEPVVPGVDIPQTLREMRAWCQANPTRRKTLRGARRFITSWLMREQNRG